jgi:hypothetical protein
MSKISMMSFGMDRNQKQLVLSILPLPKVSSFCAAYDLDCHKELIQAPEAAKRSLWRLDTG